MTHTHADTELPENVEDVINTDTKATSKNRLRKLLRDAYYAGPLPRGKSPERSTGANTSSPGSNLRRSRDGALWNLTQKQETKLLETAIDLSLIDTHNGTYFTTKPGETVLKLLDTCDTCGATKEPHYEEKTVKTGRYSSGKNHSLRTKCPACDDGPRNWSRDEFPPTTSGEDDAERIVRSIEHAALHGVGTGDWMEPALRALTDFITVVKNEYHSDFDRFLTRYSKPSHLPGAGTALKTVYDSYATDVCSDFSDLLLTTYYGACLAPEERGIVQHVAAGLPETPRSPNERHHHAESYMEPLATVDGDSWEATLRFEATGEYVTITGHADRTQSKFEYETRSGMRLSASSTRLGRVHAHPMPGELSHYDTGTIATVVAFTVTDEKPYPAESRVEQAFTTIQNTVPTDTRQFESKLNTVFTKIVTGRVVNTGTFNNTGVSYELTNTECVELARTVRQWITDSPDITTDSIPPLIERYANKTLQ